MNKRLQLRTAALIACAMLLGAGGCASSASSSTSIDGETLVKEQCGRCHPLERVNGVTKDQAGWTATVGRMRTNGVTVSDEQAAAIVDYLTKRDAAK